MADTALGAGGAVAFSWDLRREVIRLRGEVQPVLGIDPGTHTLSAAAKLAAIHPNDRPRFVAALEAARRTGTFLCRYDWSCADGSIVHLLDSGSVTAPPTRLLEGITLVLSGLCATRTPTSAPGSGELPAPAGEEQCPAAPLAASGGPDNVADGDGNDRGGEDGGDSDVPAALWLSEARLRLMTEENPIGVLQGDVYGNIHEANDAFLRLVGYSRDDLHSGRITSAAITPPEYLPADRLAIEQARATGACTPYEKVCRRKDGTTVPVLVGFTLFDERRELSAAFVLDLTELRRTRDSLQAALDAKNRLLAQKDALLRELNHRVKNSLQMVSGMLRLQSHTACEAIARDALAEADRRVMTIARLHDQLRVPNDAMGWIDVGRYLRDIGAELSATLAAPGGPVSLEVAAQPLVLPADRAVYLALIVSELATNAAKHAFPDNRVGHIRVSLDSVPDDSLLLSVADDGRGLPAGTAEIAQPRHTSGGLGFPLVETLASSLGGTLRVESSREGTRVSLQFPASPTKGTAAQR